MIDTLIQQAEDARHAASAQQQLQQMQDLKQLNLLLEQVITEHGLAELLPPVKAKHGSATNGRVTMLWCEFHPTALQLAPFRIGVEVGKYWLDAPPEAKADVGRYEQPYAWFSSYTRDDHVYFGPCGEKDGLDKLPELLLERRQRFLQQQAEAVKEAETRKARAIENGLNNLDLNSAYYRTLSEAQHALDSLLAAAPERETEWREQHALMVAAINAREEKKADEHRRKVAAAAALKAAWIEYAKERAARKARNLAKVNALQVQLDQPFVYHILTYALLGENEDGARELDTDTAYVANGLPDQDGYWLVINHNELHRIKYLNVVSVEGPLTTKPTELTRVARSTWVRELGQSVFSSPFLSAPDLTALELEAEPAEPSVPDEDLLHGYERQEIIAQAQREAATSPSETEAELAF